MNQNEFKKITLPFEHNLFNELSTQINFENVGKGRIGNHLVKVSDKGIPIVRTTTQYNIPAHEFSDLHSKIINSINSNFVYFPEIKFNNALIEIYDNSYSKMKYHSDQCLDLVDDSYIGLFSCYEKPNKLEKPNIRILKIQNKTTNEEFDISLTHNSFVLFSVKANTNFSHKIILDSTLNQKEKQTDNRWLGITFRESKTFIKFKNKMPYLSCGSLLELADENQKKEFFMLRSQENRSVNFTYPQINFTISKADTLMPIR